MADIKKSLKEELNEAKKLCVFGIGHYLFPWKPVGGLGNTDEEVLFTNKCGPWCDDWIEGVCQFDEVKAKAEGWGPPTLQRK